MPRLVHLLSLVLLLAAGAPGALAEEPTSLDELKSVLNGLAERLGRLVKEAEKDPRNEIVDRYLAQDEEAFKDRQRVKAKEMVEILEDVEATPEVRVRAGDALVSNQARTYDPDLLVEKGQKKPRNLFCKRYLVPLLKREDPKARKLAQKVLLLFFREAQRDPSIGMFTPESATKGQRDRAAKAWNRFLNK